MIDKCYRCGEEKIRLVYDVLGIDTKVCMSCSKKESMNIVVIPLTVRVNLKDGNAMVFGDTDDYMLDNENGWLHICKDDKKKATLSLSEVKSVFVE